MRASVRITFSGNGATFFAAMSTCSVMFSEVADTQPSAGVEQLLEIVDALGVVVEQLERDAHRIAFVQFAQIAHMRFRREGRMLPGVEIVQPDAEQFVGLVDAAVEQHVVVGHVEMAVVVDPVLLDPHHEETKGAKNSGSRSVRSSIPRAPAGRRTNAGIVTCRPSSEKLHFSERCAWAGGSPPDLKTK